MNSMSAFFLLTRVFPLMTVFSVAVEANEERLFITAENGDLYTLQSMLDAGVDPNRYFTDSGDTPPHYAARAEQTAAVIALPSHAHR